MITSFSPLTRAMHGIAVMVACLFSFSWLAQVQADLGFYDAVYVVRPEMQNDLTSPPILKMEIKTSFEYLAGTNDDVVFTFIGEFSSSGPHSLGHSLPEGYGYQDEVDYIQLDRQIGRLGSVFMQKTGFDGWLCAEMKIELYGNSFEMDLTSQFWLDNYSAEVAEENDGDGFEPDAQTQYPVKESVEIFPLSSSQLYTAQGDPRS